MQLLIAIRVLKDRQIPGRKDDWWAWTCCSGAVVCAEVGTVAAGAARQTTSAKDLRQAVIPCRSGIIPFSLVQPLSYSPRSTGVLHRVESSWPRLYAGLNCIDAEFMQ